MEYLLERYVPITEEDDMFLFVDPTATFGVALTLNSDYKPEYMVNIIFMPIDTKAEAKNYVDIVQKEIELKLSNILD